MSITLRTITADDRLWVRQFLLDRAGDTRVVSRGVVHEADVLPGLIASYNGADCGLLTYNVVGDEFEVVTLHTTRWGLGLGTRLLEAAQALARTLGCRRLWLITTNDNIRAFRFYQRRGLVIATVRVNALELTRRVKPEVPLIGLDNIPLRDEIELEARLS